MHGDGFIRIFDNAAPDDLCNRMLEAHMDMERNNQTQLGRAHNGGVSLNYRSHVKTKFLDSSPILEEMREVIARCRDTYIEEHGLRYEEGIVFEEELFSIKRYPVGCGLFDEHADIAPPTKKREISILVYLNTVDKGGDTHFIYQNQRVAPVRGRVVVFPSSWMFFHEGMKPVTNDKILVTAFHQINRR